MFAQQTKTGDKADLAQVPEDADIWNRVTSTRENCLGQECPHVRDCFVLKARRQAQDADLVVVNHALFMADLALREDGITDLLPAADLVVFDEAHQLPDIATRFLGTSVSSHQLLDLARAVEAVDDQTSGRGLVHGAQPWAGPAAGIAAAPGSAAGGFSVGGLHAGGLGVLGGRGLRRAGRPVAAATSTTPSRLPLLALRHPSDSSWHPGGCPLSPASH